MTPTTISLHPQGGLVAHYADRSVPFSQIPADERAVLMAEIVARFNAHDALALRAAAVPEEAHL